MRECDVWTELKDFCQPLASSPLPSSDIQPSTHTNMSLGQRSLTRRRGTSSQGMLVSGRWGRIAKALLWFLSLSMSTGEFWANSVLELLRKLWLAFLQKFRSRFVMFSTATSRIEPPTSTTRNLEVEEHIAQVSAQFIVDHKQTVRDMTICLHHLTKSQALGNDPTWCE